MIEIPLCMSTGAFCEGIPVHHNIIKWVFNVCSVNVCMYHAFTHLRTYSDLIFNFQYVCSTQYNRYNICMCSYA